jgi:ABC-type transport system involved in Fe-S cluster assembly fused permease/ATPase subunit
MQNLIRGRTTFVIAHRLATVIHADWILVLQNGRQLQSAPIDLLTSPPGNSENS